MRAVIFANGEIANISAVKSLLRKDDFIISADGGMRYLQALNTLPDLLIGDLDSASSESIEIANNSGIEIKQFPSSKDETDLELAILEAKERGCSVCLVIGALGGRMDQTLANISLLAHRRDDFTVSFDDGCESIALVKDVYIFQGTVGDTVSLIPVSPIVTGVTTTGLQYPLKDEPLYQEKTRGISNVMTGPSGEIRVRSGVLLCIRRRKSCEREWRHNEKKNLSG